MQAKFSRFRTTFYQKTKNHSSKKKHFPLALSPSPKDNSPCSGVSPVKDGKIFQKKFLVPRNFFLKIFLRRGSLTRSLTGYA